MNELSLFNSLFDNFGNDFEKVYQTCQTPKVDVKEFKDSYLLEMELPGKSEKDIDIELNQNVITISSVCEKNTDNEKSKDNKNEKWLIHERSFSQFSRSFTLPDDVNLENLSANVKDGVLKITMPRFAKTEPKRIAVTCA